MFKDVPTLLNRNNHTQISIYLQVLEMHWKINGFYFFKEINNIRSFVPDFASDFQH